MDGVTVINDPIEIAFLWYNLIAPTIVIAIAIVLQALLPRKDYPIGDAVTR